MPFLRGLLVLSALMVSAAGAQSSYTLPVQLAKISNPIFLKPIKNSEYLGLSAAQQAALTAQGFVISPAKWKQFDAAYEATRYLNQPIFVSTDSMLHIYHLVFDKLLRDLERESLAPAVKKMTTLLLADARKQYATLKNTPLAKDSLNVVAYFAVAQKLINPSSTPPAEVASMVAGELKLIDAHARVDRSVIFSTDNLTEDYSQYVPRGHYTRSEELKRYFRSMIWLGRINLRVEKDSETRSAALITALISNNAEAQKLWAKVYDPTALLVGKSDDLEYRQYVPLVKKAIEGDVKNLAKPAVLSSLQKELAKLPPPKINSVFVVAKPGEGTEVRQRETLGFRMMGQRFTLDGAVFQEMVYRSVGTLEKPRELPRGLDLLSAMGSDTALAELNKLGDNKYANFSSQMQKARAQFNSLKPADWNANVYSGWLYTLQAFAKPEARDNRYPAFMRTPAWTRKEMLTALGSWTELRHDTLLYAKQTMAEMGAGEEPAAPKGYVEPNTAIWIRLQTLEALTRKVLKDQGVLSTRTTNNLNELRDMLAFLNNATSLELAGKTLSTDGYDRIKYYGGWLEQMKLASSDPQNGENADQFDENTMAAVVADVATGNGTALEEGTGYIDEIYAIVPNGEGGIQVARGGVYSQYEFAVPSSNRLTDEAWREMLRKGKIPAIHPWLKGIVVK